MTCRLTTPLVFPGSGTRGGFNLRIWVDDVVGHDGEKILAVGHDGCEGTPNFFRRPSGGNSGRISSPPEGRDNVGHDGDGISIVGHAVPAVMPLKGMTGKLWLNTRLHNAIKN